MNLNHSPWWKLGRNAILFLFLALTAANLVTAPGCSCTEDPNEVAKREAEEKRRKAEEEKKKKEKKKDFVLERLSTLPSDGTLIGTQVKPGHWAALRQPTIANNFDFQGEIEAAAVDEYQHPLAVERTRFGVEVTRPASLPKGQLRAHESMVFIPRWSKGGKKPWVKAELRSRGNGRVVSSEMFPTSKLESFEYFLVVLANNPNSYGYVKTLHSVKPPSDDIDVSRTIRYYQVMIPEMKPPLPLPSQSLAWSTTAAILWDDIDPNALSFDQQQAMIDWLHFGGQIIIAGPQSLPKLADSFLAPYLPATNDGDGELGNDDFAEINNFYATKSEKYADEPHKLDLKDGKIRGVNLALTDSGSFVPHTGDLVAEAQVGRGRVCVTAFPLTDRRLKNWNNLDNFFNCVLLRRPGREYKMSPYDLPTLVWQDKSLSVNDARLTTQLRYFSHDIAASSDDVLPDPEPEEDEEIQSDGFDLGYTYGNVHEESIWDKDPNSVGKSNPEYWRYHGYDQDENAGVGAWNDFSGASNAARDSLREASGISVPKAGFIAQVLGIYLLVLVPLNWIIFRLMGRVEWAWIAAPIIAIVGAVAVARLAQLDIGFARSRTEVVMVEAFGGHDRAHVTRYSALYSSLSTYYDITMDNEQAVVQPFSADPDFRLRSGEQATTLQMARGSEQELRGFPVTSNTTDLIRSEQLTGMGGAISLDASNKTWRLINDSKIPLQEAVVLYNDPDQKATQICYLGEVAPETTTPLNFKHRSDNGVRPKQWDESPVMTLLPSAESENELNLGKLASLATETLTLLPGEARLIAWSDQPPGEVNYSPAASQRLIRALVLVHLQSPPLPDPTPDKNLEVDVNEERRSATEL